MGSWKKSNEFHTSEPEGHRLDGSNKQKEQTARWNGVSAAGCHLGAEHVLIFTRDRVCCRRGAVAGWFNSWVTLVASIYVEHPAFTIKIHFDNAAVFYNCLPTVLWLPGATCIMPYVGSRLEICRCAICVRFAQQCLHVVVLRVYHHCYHRLTSTNVNRMQTCP